MRNNITLERRKFNHQVLAILMGGISVSSIGCDEEKKTKGSAPVLLTSSVMQYLVQLLVLSQLVLVV